MAQKTKRVPKHHQLYEIAERQAGYFTASQARTAGFTQPLLSYHTRTGQFTRVRRGIYRLTRFPEQPHADLFVAWLQTGPNSVISHESALALYELSDILPGQVHVTVPRTASRRRQGIRLHTNRLPKGEITHRAGLPVTAVTRTLADVIGNGVPEEQINQAIQEALTRGLVTEQMLFDIAVRRGGQVERMVRHALHR
jgi:predicted transcriptional regulator of viral defense system